MILPSDNKSSDSDNANETNVLSQPRAEPPTTSPPTYAEVSTAEAFAAPSQAASAFATSSVGSANIPSQNWSTTPGPPPGFSRQPPVDLPPPKFSPMYLTPAFKNSLSRGFPAAPPPCDVRPHPFSTCDVTAEDWHRFIEELHEMSKLSQKDKNMVYKIPYISIIPFVAPLLQHGFEFYARTKKPMTAASVVDIWNRHFFHPRKLDVALYKGPERLSSAPPPSSNPFAVGGKVLPEDAAAQPQSQLSDQTMLISNHPKHDKDQFRLYVFPLR